MLLLLLATLLLLNVHSISAVTKTFTVSSENIANPERGFYKDIEKPGAAVNSATIAGYRNNQKYTMVLYIWYLKKYINQNVPQSVLDEWKKDIAAIRTGGAKCVIRFAYTDDDKVKPHDATLDQVKKHIAQFKPLVQANIDVIFSVQVGWVGVWGEWGSDNKYSTNFVTKSNLPDYVSRKQVADAVLDMAKPRMVQLRTPMQKKAMYSKTAMTEADSHKDTSNSRIGFHNDCFLATANDDDTYESSADRDYAAKDTLYTPMGGETCKVNRPRSECTSAQQELAKYHWTYLNTDFNQTVLNSWKSGDCMETIKKSLGYRLFLTSANYTSPAAPGKEVSVTINLKNDGYAAPVYDRSLSFVLRKGTQTYNFSISSSVKVWKWYGKQTASFTQKFTIPANAAAGTYTLLFKLADKSSKLAALPHYSIQLANKGTWEASTGLNIIGDITVTK